MVAHLLDVMQGWSSALKAYKRTTIHERKIWQSSHEDEWNIKKFGFISRKVMATSSIIQEMSNLLFSHSWKSQHMNEAGLDKSPSLHKIILCPIHCIANYRQWLPHISINPSELSIYQLQIVDVDDWKTALFRSIRF